MKLDRLESIASELSASLLRSIVVPQGGWLGWLGRHRSERSREKQGPFRSEDAHDLTAPELPAGPVVLLGGAPVPDEAVVESIHLVGGRSARVAVIPVAAAADRSGAAAEAVRLFTRFGMKRVEVFDLQSREQATNPAVCSALATFEAVVLCGESPSQGLEVLQATLAAATLREMVDGGKLLVGLDAGAAILGSRVFPGDEAVLSTSGLRILSGLLIDTQFAQRSRFSRLATALSEEEGACLLGVGLDAGAAAVILDGKAKVLGEGGVTFLDPRPWPPGQGPESDGLKVHLLTEGHRMNLLTRRPCAPEKGEAVAR